MNTLICIEIIIVVCIVSAIIVKFASTLYSILEGEMVELCVKLERGQLERNVHFSIDSQSDTAQVDADFIALHLSLALRPDESQRCFIIKTLDDSLVEGEESFQVVLVSHDPAVIVSTPGTAHINIHDSDSKPRLINFPP